MDQQTLKYMGERVDKARLITAKIEDLKADLHDMVKYEANIISIERDGSKLARIRSFKHDGKPAHPRLVETLSAMFREAVKEEIAILEGELAEI